MHLVQVSGVLSLQSSQLAAHAVRVILNVDYVVYGASSVTEIVNVYSPLSAEVAVKN